MWSDPILIIGIRKYSMSKTYHKRGLWAIKASRSLSSTSARPSPQGSDKKKKSVKGTPTQLKIEKAVEGNLAKLLLAGENTTTSTPKPEEKNTNRAVIAEKPFQFPFRHPCELCNVFGHWHHFCPYLECIPDNVTQIPKGYEI